jgi:hypothetical protein
MDTGTRTDHLAWVKARALEYVELGELVAAVTSLTMDLTKHSATARHPGILNGTALLADGHLATDDEVRQFIESIE